MKILSLLLLLALPSLGQTLTFVDDSPSDNPFTWKGTVTYNQNGQAKCALTGHNNSSRMIVAYRVQFDITTPSRVITSAKHRQDYFLKPQGYLVETAPQPRLDYQFPDFCDLILSFQPDFKSDDSPAVHIKTLFVQLDDGTVWGADDIVQEIMYQRTMAVDYLKSLAAAYENGGASALTEALKQGPEGPNPKPGQHLYLAMGKFEWLRRLSDTTAQINQINADLALADARSAWLK